MAVDMFSVKKIYSFPVSMPDLNRDSAGTLVESAVWMMMLVKKKEVNIQYVEKVMMINAIILVLIAK
jgi:hypothetical protein